jgi:hypothetical protein
MERGKCSLSDSFSRKGAKEKNIERKGNIRKRQLGSISDLYIFTDKAKNAQNTACLCLLCFFFAPLREIILMREIVLVSLPQSLIFVSGYRKLAYEDTND